MLVNSLKIDKKYAYENIMKDLGAIQIIASYLHPNNRNAYQVKLAALNWLAQLCFENVSNNLKVSFIMLRLSKSIL